jgi:4-amino-4-deoxy-L-arabinose transferase-like glycosyltransferase
MPSLPWARANRRASARFEQSPRLLDFGLTLLALVIGGWAVLALRQPWAKETSGAWVWLVFVAASALGAAGLARMDRWLPEAFPRLDVFEAGAAASGQTVPRIRRLGFACLAGAVLFCGWVVFRLWPGYRDWDGTVWPWLLAMALTALGGFLLSRPAVRRQADQNAAPGAAKRNTPGLALPRWVEPAAFLAILAAAIFLRLYRLGEIPAGIYVDETNGALDALYLLEGSHQSPFGTGWYGVPTMYAYYMAGLYKLFGITYGTLKAASLIPAILTVPAAYLLGRLMFGSLAGLSAMAFLAFSRWHLSMSRWGWVELTPPLFQILATYFLLRALRTRRPLDFVLGGLITGLMMYTYLASRLAIATLGLFIVYWLVVERQGIRAALQRHWRGLALFALAAAIAAAPIAVTHITDPFTWSNRVDEISIFRDIKDAGSYQPLLYNIRDHLRFFHQIGDHQGKHNLPDEPQADPVLGLLFVIGLAYGLWRWRDRRQGLLWFWLLFGLVGGVFSSNHESPQSFRTLTALPALALLGGDVLSRLVRAPQQLFPPLPASGGWMSPRQRRRRWIHRLAGVGFPAVLLAGSLGGSLAWESSRYFGPQASSIAVQSGFNLPENQVAIETLQALASGTPVYLSPRFYDFSPLRFYIYGYYKKWYGINTLDQRPYHLTRPEQDLPVPDEGDDALFLLDTYYASVIDFFTYYYPHAQVEEVRWRGELPLYLRVRVPRQDLEDAQGLLARLTRLDGTAIERHDANIDETRIWHNPAGAQEVASAEWTGSLRLDQSGEYDFSSQGSLQLILDGEPWQGKRFLCDGLHSLQVMQPDRQAGGPPQLRWVVPSGKESVIPPGAFYRVPLPDHGLTGTYYANPAWEGEPLCVKRTPYFLLAWPDGNPVQGPFSAHFTGVLRIDQPGLYGLRLFADDGVRLSIDGTVLGEGLVPDRPNAVTVEVELSTGDHEIQIDYFQQGGGSALEFFWTPPGLPEAPVPPAVLIPDDSGG